MSHIAKFVSGLWQIHPFGEGNTRTTAVFAILYLRSMGFDVTNDLLANLRGISFGTVKINSVKIRCRGLANQNNMSIFAAANKRR